MRTLLELRSTAACDTSGYVRASIEELNAIQDEIIGLQSQNKQLTDDALLKQCEKKLEVDQDYVI